MGPVVDSLLACLCFLPLAFSDMRVAVSPQVVCSDASEEAGGGCVSSVLTEAGKREAALVGRRAELPDGAAVVLVCVGDVTGSLLRGW